MGVGVGPVGVVLLGVGQSSGGRTCSGVVTMMPIRVHSASHSSMLWVVRITEHFSRLVTMSEMISHMKRRATGSMPAWLVIRIT